ncbi:ankyrin repeat domain-containing protein 26-like [Erethizon dorsatum]
MKPLLETVLNRTSDSAGLGSCSSDKSSGDADAACPQTTGSSRPAIEREDSVPSEAVGMKDVQTLKSEEPDLEVTSKKEQKRRDGCENNQDQNVPKVNLTELWAAAQQSRKNRKLFEAKYGIGEPGNRTLIDNCISDSKNKDMVETLTKTSVNVQDFSPSSFSSPSREPKEKATGPAIRKEKGSQEQTNDNVTNVDGGQKNYESDMMLALGLGEDDESPWDSESISENLPQKSVDHLFGAADERGKPAGNRQVGEEPDLEVTSKKEQKRLDGCENNQDHVEEKRKQISSEMEASENQYGATVATAVDDNGGLTQQRKSGETDNQQFPTKKKEEHDGSEPALPLRKVKKNENEQWSSTESVISPVFKKADSLSGGLLQVKSGRKLHDTDEDEGRSTKRTSNEKSKVKKKISAVGDCADLSQSSETPSEESPLPYPKDETILLLFIRFRMECKGRTSTKMQGFLMAIVVAREVRRWPDRSGASQRGAAIGSKRVARGITMAGPQAPTQPRTISQDEKGGLETTPYRQTGNSRLYTFLLVRWGSNVRNSTEPLSPVSTGPAHPGSAHPRLHPPQGPSTDFKRPPRVTHLVGEPAWRTCLCGERACVGSHVPCLTLLPQRTKRKVQSLEFPVCRT